MGEIWSGITVCGVEAQPLRAGGAGLRLSVFWLVGCPARLTQGVPQHSDMRHDSQLVSEDKEPEKVTLWRISMVAGFVIVVGLIAGVLFSPDSGLFKARTAPAVLFGAIGVGGLVNVALNVRFWRQGRLLQKRVTPESDPARYWLLFALFTALSITSLILAILFAAGLLVKTPAKPNRPDMRSSLGHYRGQPGSAVPRERLSSDEP